MSDWMTFICTVIVSAFTAFIAWFSLRRPHEYHHRDDYENRPAH